MVLIKAGYRFTDSVTSSTNPDPLALLLMYAGRAFLEGSQDDSCWANATALWGSLWQFTIFISPRLVPCLHNGAVTLSAETAGNLCTVHGRMGYVLTRCLWIMLLIAAAVLLHRIQ